jgi:oligopeptide transport system substrate-binding protein
MIALLFALTGCKDHTLNNPHTSDTAQNIRYTSFNESPKTLDPAQSYSVDEAVFVSQIYEPPLQYHYLKRPYTLVPLTATQMPVVTYYDKQKKKLPDNAPAAQIAYSTYDIAIQPGIYYQPHPVFAKDVQGNYLYHHLSDHDLSKIKTLDDFKATGTRELTADDYVYEIKRLADPQVNSPILAVMENYIVGLKQYIKTLQTDYQKEVITGKQTHLDLRQYPLLGAEVIDRYHYRITLQGKYPQFIYWLAMSFFSPVPWEAVEFFSQPGLQAKNITLAWHPVGTGAYMLTKNNPNQVMLLSRNPNFHTEYYPSSGDANDKAKGLLANAGKRLPFIDQYSFTLEKESIPRWNKFLQGYYDASQIASDNFDQAIQINSLGQPQATKTIQQKNIRLLTSVQPNIFFFGFNMLDDVVGGYTDRARKLRQAISIALDTEQFISIFLNGRGFAAQGPIPPGIFGYVSGEQGIDPYVYSWQNNKSVRRSIEEAKKLLAEAGYPNGREVKTGKPLIINYDATMTSSADEKSQFDWMREKFAKLGIQLNVRATQYNRFQEKLRSGNTQMFLLGWVPDYPDPENFLFLLYGPNGKVKSGGENAANYKNDEYDSLFTTMKMLPNGPERQTVINKMVAILQQDAPWVWGFYPKEFLLSHQWTGPVKLDAMGYNTLKYGSLNPQLRREKQLQWNQPKLWPLGLLLLLLLIVLLPVFINYWRKQHQSRTKRINL